MNAYLKPLKWLLEVNVRVKNALSLLSGLLSVVTTFIKRRQLIWFQDAEQFGPMALVAALFIVLFVAFLTTWLLVTAAESLWRHFRIRCQARKTLAERIQLIRRNLQGLSPWQRQFLLRFVVEGRTQIPAFEVGEYRAAWDFEMDVLLSKRIIIEHSSEVYEIQPSYLEYLKHNWNPEKGELA